MPEAAETHVYTVAELRDPPNRPRVRAGVAYRVATPFTAPSRPDDADEGRYRVPSPCCGIVTTVPHSVVAGMLANQNQHWWIYCGKPFWHTRGRGAGCRARYRLLPIPADPRPEQFDLTWTGF